MKKIIKQIMVVVLIMVLFCITLDANAITTKSNKYNDIVDTIVNGCMAQDTEIDLNGFQITSSQLQKIVNGVLDNYPEVYLRSDKFSYRYADTTDKISVLFVEYRFSRLQLNKMQEKIDKKATRILSKIKKNASDYEKVLYIHNYLAKHCKYDKTKSKPNAYNMYGCLIKGRAVCQGYSQAFEYLLKKAGIESCYVSSRKMKHGWNRVLLNGNWYNVDVTWDSVKTNRKYNKVKWKYFLKSDKEFKKLKHYGSSCFYNTACKKSYI